MSLYAALTVSAAVATGLAGGVTYAFSSFVMAGLRRLPPDAGAAAMQEINRTAVRPPLGVMLGASVVLPAASAALGLAQGRGGAGLAAVGAGVAVVGILGVTGLGNVPLNDRLMASDERADEWQRIYDPWMRWNHLRTLAAAVSCVLLVAAVPAAVAT